MSSSAQDAGAYKLQENISLAEEQGTFKNQLTDLLREASRTTNIKETAIYEDIEINTSGRFFGSTPQEKREVYRKTFRIGAIAAGATLNTAHGLTAVTAHTRIYGTVVTATGHSPIPRASATLVTDQVSLDVVGANIVIVNGATAPNITSGFVILEYLKS